MVSGKSGRGKVRGFIKKDINAGRLYTFWVYDFRTKVKENIWRFLLERHNRCTYDSRTLRQDTSLPIVRLEVFLCFNCLNKNCFWDLNHMSNEVFERCNSEDRIHERSIRWREDEVL